MGRKFLERALGESRDDRARKKGLSQRGATERKSEESGPREGGKEMWSE